MKNKQESKINIKNGWLEDTKFFRIVHFKVKGYLIRIVEFKLDQIKLNFRKRSFILRS